MLSLPKAFKYCLRCGGKLVWRSKQRLGICASCRYEMYDEPKLVVTGLLIDDTYRVLLGKRARTPHRGAWGTLGGFVEVGETGEEALRREMREELDTRLGTLEYFASIPGIYPYQGVALPYLEIVFIGRGPDLRKVRADKSEITALKYFAVQDIPFARLAFASQRTALRAYRRSRLLHK